MSPFSIYFCKRLNISHAIKPCPVCVCLASQRRNSLIQGREAMRKNGGMRSRKGQGKEGEVNFEKMNQMFYHAKCNFYVLGNFLKKIQGSY